MHQGAARETTTYYAKQKAFDKSLDPSVTDMEPLLKCPIRDLLKFA